MSVGLQLGPPGLDADLARDPFNHGNSIPREEGKPIATALQSRDDVAGIASHAVIEAEANRRLRVAPVPDLAFLPAAFDATPFGGADPLFALL